MHSARDSRRTGGLCNRARGRIGKSRKGFHRMVWRARREQRVLRIYKLLLLVQAIDIGPQLSVMCAFSTSFGWREPVKVQHGRSFVEGGAKRRPGMSGHDFFATDLSSFTISQSPMSFERDGCRGCYHSFIEGWLLPRRNDSCVALVERENRREGRSVKSAVIMPNAKGITTVAMSLPSDTECYSYSTNVFFVFAPVARFMSSGQSCSKGQIPYQMYASSTIQAH